MAEPTDAAVEQMRGHLVAMAQTGEQVVAVLAHMKGPAQCDRRLVAPGPMARLKPPQPGVRLAIEPRWPAASLPATSSPTTKGRNCG